MHGAFVVQLGPETKPAEGRFEGWVEEVDSCTELRFRSSEELLKFVGQRFDLARASVDKTRACNKSEQVSPRKKTSRKEEVRYEHHSDSAFTRLHPDQLVCLPNLWEGGSFCGSHHAQCRVE